MRKMVLSLAVATFVTGGAMAGLGADDWPQWRGPGRDGHSPSKGLLKQWPAGGPKLAWKATGLGSAFATVSVVGDRIFTIGDLDDGSYAIALNRADGKPAWKTKIGKTGAPGWGGFAGPRCSPTVDGDLLYVVAQYGEAACLKAADGRFVWKKDCVKDLGGELPYWGYSGHPLVDGDHMILATGGKKGNLVALNKKSGELVWRSTDLTDSIHYSSPIVAEIGGVRQYVQLTETNVAGIAAEDGRVLWLAARKGRTAVIPTPIYHDGFVYISSGYGAGCNLFKITAEDGKFSANEVYANSTMTNQHGGVVRVGDHVYGFSDDKGWTCQDLKTGEAVWQQKSKLPKGSIAFADGMLYLRTESGRGSDKGTLALIEASPEGYKEKGRFDQPERSDKNSWPHPVIVDGKLYVRDQDVLLCYDVRAE